MCRALLIVPFLLVACSDDDATSSPPTTVETTTTAVDGIACDDLEGMDTDEVIALLDGTGCVDDDGGLFITGNLNLECANGSTLYWNDTGWGYSDQTWHAHEAGRELIAPDSEQEACTG